jgi:hypothetical protein
MYLFTAVCEGNATTNCTTLNAKRLIPVTLAGRTTRNSNSKADCCECYDPGTWIGVGANTNFRACP